MIWRQKRAGFIWIFISTVLIASICFYLLPQIKIYHEQKETWQRLQETTFNLEWWKIYQKLKEESEENSNRVKSMESQIILKDDSIVLMEILQRISFVANVRLVSFQLGSMKPDRDYLIQSVHMRTTGSYRETVIFLSLIDQSFLTQRLDYTITLMQDKLQCMINLDLYLK